MASVLHATRVPCPHCNQPKRRACVTKSGRYALQSHAVREDLVMQRRRDPAVFQIQPWTITDPAIPEGNHVIGEYLDPYTETVTLVHDLTDDREILYQMRPGTLKFIDYAVDFLERLDHAIP